MDAKICEIGLVLGSAADAALEDAVGLAVQELCGKTWPDKTLLPGHSDRHATLS